MAIFEMKGKITGSVIVDEKLAKVKRQIDKSIHICQRQEKRLISIVSPIIISDDALIKKLNRICKECDIEVEDFLIRIEALIGVFYQGSANCQEGNLAVTQQVL